VRGAAAFVLLLGCRPESTADSGVPAQDGTDTPMLSSAEAVAGPDAIVEVGVPLTLDGAASTGVAFAWDFGDGQSAEGATVTHAWSEPGNYAVVLAVTGEDGGWRSDSLQVVVHAPLLEPAPVASGMLARSADGGTLYAALPEADAVIALDLGSGAAGTHISCGEPRTVAVSPTGAVGAACAGEDAVTVREPDGTTWSVGFEVGAMPVGVVPNGGSVWAVSLAGVGAVARVQASGELSREDVGPDPRALAWLPGGAGERTFVARWRSGPGGGRVQALGASPATLPVDERGDSDTTTGGVPNLIEQVVPTPDGLDLVLPMAHSNDLRGAWLTGEDLLHDVTVRAVVSLLDPDAAQDDVAARKQLDDRGRANAVVPSPYGDKLYLVHTGTRTVSILDRWTQNVVGSIWDVGAAPTAAVVSPDGGTLYVYAWLEREVRAYDVSGASVPPAELGRWPLLDEEPLSAEVLLGKQIFWDAADKRITRAGYISCANCHPDGDHDGRTWDFTDRGEGLRNTPSLLGRAGMGMGPVHWSANFDEIQDFENDMRGPFGGLGFLSDADWAEAGETLGPAKAGRSAELDALAAYVASLEEAPVSPFSAEAGDEAAFEAAGCGDCHPAPLYTDSDLDSFVRHDIGTLTEASGQRLGGGPLDGVDTPTLLGAWASAPYLHDGTATDLRAAVLAHDGADALPEADLDAIVRFVRSL
jgi:DNA-binding beta-propeller fold protein YncE